MMRQSILTAALGVLLILTGCSMAPRYVRPAMPVTDSWPADILPRGELTPVAARSAASLGWKQFFADPHLRQVILLALMHNRDLRVTALNITKMRGAYQIQRSEQLPGVGISGTYEDTGTFTSLSRDGLDSNTHNAQLAVGISSFELDFFGRIQSLKDEALENYLSTEQAWRSARLSLIAEVAAAYLTLTADRERLAISQETLSSQSASYAIIRRKFEAGVASELDVRQAQTSVEQARVNIALYTGYVAQDRNYLSLLAGTRVEQSMLPAGRLADLPAWPEVPVGLPSQVLLLRPDVLAAEHDLKAANADIGAARANFFPRISLTAGLGTASREMDDLFSHGTGIWAFAPQVTLPLFTGGGNLAILRVSEANQNIMVAKYEKAIQSAFREVSDGLALRTTLNEQLHAQEALTQAASEAYRLSSARYAQGIESYLNVLDSQRAMYNAQLALVGATKFV